MSLTRRAESFAMGVSARFRPRPLNTSSTSPASGGASGGALFFGSKNLCRGVRAVDPDVCEQSQTCLIGKGRPKCGENVVCCDVCVVRGFE